MIKRKFSEGESESKPAKVGQTGVGTQLLCFYDHIRQAGRWILAYVAVVATSGQGLLGPTRAGHPPAERGDGKPPPYGARRYQRIETEGTGIVSAGRTRLAKKSGLSKSAGPDLLDSALPPG